jgi:hypothetical protein
LGYKTNIVTFSGVQYKLFVGDSQRFGTVKKPLVSQLFLTSASAAQLFCVCWKRINCFSGSSISLASTPSTK